MIIGVDTGHDASCCLIDETGEIVYAIMEERITRVKHQSGFPVKGVLNKKVRAIVYSWEFSFKNKAKQIFFEFPKYITNPSAFIINFYSMIKAKKSFKIYKKYKRIPCFNVEHHLAHASSAYFFSPLKDALTLVLDGRGEYASMTLFDKNLKKLEQTILPHSIGIFYSHMENLLV